MTTIRAPLPIPSPIPPSYQPQTTIQTLPLTTPLENILATLSRDGGLIIKDFIPQTDLASITTELQPWSTLPSHRYTTTTTTTTDPPSHPHDAFPTIPAQTTLIPGLVGKSSTIARICASHPLLESLRQHILLEEFTLNREGSIEENRIDPLLSLSTSMNIGYGAPRQLLHRDDNVHHIRHKNENEEWGFGDVSQFGCLIAGCDVSREMGATMFVPGSHRWGDGRVAGAGEVCFAEMTAGSALIFLASAFHGGGHNSVPGTVRTMHGLFFVRGYLRTEENQFLAVPRSKVREMGPKMLELLGYKKPTTALGIVDNISPHEDVDGVWERAM
ncbi:phytanoyl-CoA dioxygenase [Aspergillus heteromorphus CBS 117.55]|uniref:Phytanoyl-CoA dioxygenase n=1 Tax=Aspergillus heteromorphus CBS 117.55 TaxID=1448321 RepID=A0A317WPT2_9EURO|nr:phytanoyl-CoA dioxygenase [Aspergillus heteromorphus CBS 117.55]PWY87661.1 phytanoyl-CoA dioxygenase [Aspergillus heteromorphus CBS 117.55]